jgi:hypothetical protein
MRIALMLWMPLLTQLTGPHRVEAEVYRYVEDTSTLVGLVHGQEFRLGRLDKNAILLQTADGLCIVPTQCGRGSLLSSSLIIHQWLQLRGFTNIGRGVLFKAFWTRLETLRLSWAAK